jgi:hypothetical protein
MEIAHEGVALDQLYRACLLHDIGKLAIPGFILNNEANDKDWINCFILLPPDEQDEILVNNNIFAADEIRHDPGKMYEFLSRNRKRAVKFVPVKAILDDKQKAFLIENDFDPEKSLGEIMQIHEEKSEQILKKLGFVIEALLAGHHHDCKYKDEALGAKPKSLTALNIAIEIASNLIHFGDVQDALNGDRSYSHKQPMLRIMAFLVDHAESGNTDPALTAHWINDELKKMSPEYLNEIRNMTSKHQHHDYLQQRNEELLLIYDFLSDNLPENHQDHEEQMDSRLAA